MGTTTVWPAVSSTPPATSASVRPSTDGTPAWTSEPLRELARDEADASGPVDVRRVEPAPRLQVGDDRRRARDAVEVVDREVDAELARDRDEVEDAVRRAARAGDRGGSVLDRLARHDLRGPEVASARRRREPARSARPPRPSRRSAPGCRSRRAGLRPRKSTIVDIVFAVNWPPQAPGRGTGDRLELVQLVGRVIFPAAYAPIAS